MLKILLPVLGILLLVQCQNKPKEDVKQAVVNESNTVVLTDAQLKNAAVETVRLSEKNIATVLKLNGKIDVPPQNLISVSVPLGGFEEHPLTARNVCAQRGNYCRDGRPAVYKTATGLFAGQIKTALCSAGLPATKRPQPKPGQQR